ncbi:MULTISPECIES: acylphosphatase [Halomonadaceae]
MSPNDEALLERYIGQAAKAGAHWDALCAARHWVDAAVEKPAAAARVLAGLYGLLGKESLSQHWASESALVQPLSANQANETERMRVLVLGTVASGSYRYRPQDGVLATVEGHNNLAQMLDAQSVTRYRFSVDRLDDHPELIKQIPEVDIIYNGITDASRCTEALHKAEWLCDRMNVPVINHPSEVLRTTREENAQRLGDAEGVLVPRSIPLGRLEEEIGDRISEAVEQHELEAPVIMRAAGFQNGRNMHLIEDPTNVKVRLVEPAEVYLLQYHDVTYTDPRAPDHRLHPKYRAFMVGGRLYPIHLRVGHDGDWNVHIGESNRTFQKFPWLYDDEQDFLEDPEGTFAPGVWKNLERTLQRLDLGYFGVDFAVCTDPRHKGDIVIFEANASMRSFLIDTDQNTPENEAARKVIVAVHDHFCEKAGIEPWAFQLPAGKSTPATEDGFDSSDAPSRAIQLLFSGRVQGVGFRQWVRHELHRHALNGWVRNLGDGRVEAVIAGPEDALEHFLGQAMGPEAAELKSREVRDWYGRHPERVQIREAAEVPAESDEPS